MRGLKAREGRPELMDSPACGHRDLEGALRFLETTNRWFGGTSLILKHLARWMPIARSAQPIRILDVGTGAADIPLAIVRWAASRGVHAEVVGLDGVETTASIARARTAGVPAISVVTADLFDYATQGPGFDFVIANLFLHHVAPERTAAALKSCDRLARRGVLITDLRRSWPALGAVGAISHLLGNHVVRHDGPLSVRRAFTVGELSALAAEAGLPYLRARNEPWFRVSLAGVKS
jgi:ubiquinone/menaquinone biosynthesis C-methylase UbiE